MKKAVILGIQITIKKNSTLYFEKTGNFENGIKKIGGNFCKNGNLCEKWIFLQKNCNFEKKGLKKKRTLVASKLPTQRFLCSASPYATVLVWFSPKLFYFFAGNRLKFVLTFSDFEFRYRICQEKERKSKYRKIRYFATVIKGHVMGN